MGDGVKCAHCGRRLNAATQTIQTKGGPLHFGPVCARRVFAPETRARVAKFVGRPTEQDERQIEMFRLAGTC